MSNNALYQDDYAAVAPHFWDIRGVFSWPPTASGTGVVGGIPAVIAITGNFPARSMKKQQHGGKHRSTVEVDAEVMGYGTTEDYLRGLLQSLNVLVTFNSV